MRFQLVVSTFARRGPEPRWGPFTSGGTECASDGQGRARALMKRMPLIDGHNDLAVGVAKTVGYDQDKMDIGSAQPKLQTDIARLRAGQLGAQFWSVYVPSSMDGKGAVTATLEQIDAVYERPGGTRHLRLGAHGRRGRARLPRRARSPR